MWDTSSVFPLANHLALPDSESIFGITQCPPLCARISLSHDGFQRRSLWEGWHHLLWGAVSSLFDPRGALLCIVVRKVSLTSRMRNMWSLYLLSEWDSAALCLCYYLFLEVSVHRGQTSAAQPGDHLSSASTPFPSKVTFWGTRNYGFNLSLEGTQFNL